MYAKQIIFFDESKEKIMLTEDIQYVQAKVEGETEYTLSGKIYFNEKETKNKILLVVDFNDMVLSKEQSLECGFSYSEKYGAYKYLTSDSNHQFSITFLIPSGVKNIRIGIRKWYHDYDVYISSKFILKKSHTQTTTKITEEFNKQLLQTEKYLYNKLSARMHMYCRQAKSDYLVLTTRYPTYNDYYRNHFIHTRVRGYIEKGIHPDVFGMLGNNGLLKHYRFEDVHVTTGSGEVFDDLLTFHNYKNLLVHFLNERMWNYLKKYIDYTKVFVWVHGAEIQPWHRRAFNYENEEELVRAKQISQKRIEFWQSILKDPHPNLKLIFVSQHFVDEVMEDLNIVLPKSSYEIIHNYINTDLFTYEEKHKDQRKKILSIRPYASKKYANDLSVEAVLYIKEKYPEIFLDMEFTFVGDGVLFDITLEPLKSLANVKIEKKFLKQSDIAKLHKEYGVFLSPTRMDSQGVSRDEAMASGLVPITNNVTAIPEFVDELCGILAKENDYISLAEGMVRLYNNSEIFLEMSERSAQRVRKQSSYEQTIVKELDLIKMV